MRSHALGGYTLLEMALVLAIASVLMGGALTVFTQADESKRYLETQEKIFQIDAALKRFFAINRYLPCPAAGDQADGNATLGQSVGFNATTGACNAPQGGAEPRGIVPFVTLGLPQEAIYDAWGRRISYQLSDGLRLPENFENEQIVGLIQVVNPDGAGLTDPASAAAYVLVSHGGNGFYAWLADGTRLDPANVADAGVEVDNGSGSDLRYTYGDRAVDFDEILLFRSKGEVYNTRRFARLVEPRLLSCTNARSIVSLGRTAWMATTYGTGYAANADRIFQVAVAMDRYCTKSTLSTPVRCVRNTLYLGPCTAADIAANLCPSMSYSDGTALVDIRLNADCHCPGTINPAAAPTPQLPKFLSTAFADHYFGACMP